MHVANEVNEFRDDMKKLIEGFLRPPSSEAAEQPKRRRWRLCELLLVAFMREKIAPCRDDEIAENLNAWQEKCEDPEADLVACFSKLILSLKPSVFEEIGYKFSEGSRKNQTSIFAIDWMVQHSESSLKRAKKEEWVEVVVQDWFVSGNAENADNFLARAETFLQKGVKGESWGAKILGNVIQTNSYVIFFRMEALAALLLREHCALQMQQHTQRQMQQDLLEPATCAPSLPPIGLVVSSSNWHWSSAEGNDISAPHKADITARLRCIASLPCQLLEANARLLSQMEDVGSELLYSLKEIEAKHVEQMDFSWEPAGGWDASFSKILSMLDLVPSQKTLSCSEPLKASARMIISDIEKKIGQGQYSSRPEEFHSDALRVFHAQLFHDEASELGQRQMQESGATGGHGDMTDVQVLCESIWKEMQALLGSGIVSTRAAAGGACIEDVRTERGQREKQAKDIFHRDGTSRDLISGYMQSLVQDRHSQKRAFSVGTYIESASGEEHQVDGTETISVVLVPGASFNQQADEVEEALKCPISRSIMRDPVTCSNGRTYDRAWIEKWARVRRNPNDPLTREPLQCKETADGPRLQLIRNDGVRARIEAFKQQKLAELERQKQSAEGEEERNMLRSRYGFKKLERMVLKDNGGTANAKTIDSASDFLEFVTAGSASGLACLIGPPASGKTVTMQQVVYAAVSKCKAQMEQQVSVPLLPVFMRAAVLSSLISENEATVGESKVIDLRQLLELFLAHGVEQGVFPATVEKCILDLYDLDCILICIDGLDEAAAHQELVEISIEHAVKSAADSQRRVHVLLSTREHSYIHSRACLRLGDFDVVDLQPLNQARQKQMVQGRIQSAEEVDAFLQQLAAIAGRNHELAASPFLLSLMIEVYLKEGKIPSRRVELYEKQVHAMVKRCMQERLNEKDILDRLEVVARFLETLAFVCQMRLATRDFMLDECASDVKELWRDGDAALTEAQQLLFTPPVVGLLADVGGKRYRFNHLTLQEYLAAKCALRLFECAGARTLLENLRQGESLFSRWRREVLQFIACMMREEMFPEFCQVLLEMDDGTGACCELVRDFLKERGPSEAVERMLRDQMQKIRGTDLLLAGLCHPCPEMRSLVLSEMSQFRVPPNPFADETVPKLKEIAEDTSCAWHKRAAAILSLAQIAQMKHCSRSDRAETIRWVLKMLQSESYMLENVHFALVKGLGTMLKEGGDSAAGGGILLHREDESVLLQPGLRESIAIADALSDLKIYSAGLVDWLELGPSPKIAQGRWPIRHVHFLCENVAASNDSQRASRLVNSLLHRLHSSSFQISDQALLLMGLFAVHALVAADGWSQVLPFLESGDAEQRTRVLEAAVEINVRFEGEDATGRLAQCLLLEMEPTRAHERSETLLSYVLKKEAGKYRYSSLRESSNVFVFLVNIMGQSTGDSQQVVSRYLMDFEQPHVGEKPEKGKEGYSGVYAALVESNLQKESDQPTEPRLLTTNASSIDWHLREFLPGILDQKDASKATDVCERYCAASLWTSSGLVQAAQAEKITRWAALREDERARVVKAFEDLKHLQEPWMQGRDDGPPPNPGYKGVMGPLPSIQQVKQQVAMTPRLPPPQLGVSSAMANAAGEGYVVRAPIPGSNKGHELKKQLKETDALEYLNLVKVQFGDSPEIYNKFLDIMKDFKSHAIDTQKVIERVSKLFAGHQRLILGFNTFLPAGYKIEVRNPAQGGGGGMNKKAAAPEFDHAYSYVSKIKQRFSNQTNVYQQFLQILQRYKEEGFAKQRVKQQMAMLFKGHEDLLGEFSNFLPDSGAPSDKLPAAQKGGKKKGGVGSKEATVQTLPLETLLGAHPHVVLGQVLAAARDPLLPVLQQHQPVLAPMFDRVCVCVCVCVCVIIQGLQTKGGGGVQKGVQGGGGEGMGTTRHKGFMDQQASKGSIDFLCGGGGGNDGRMIKEEDRALSPSHTGTSRLSATPPQRKFGGDGGVHPTEYSGMNTAKAGDSQQVVSRYLTDIESAHVVRLLGEKSEKGKAEEKANQGGEKPAIGKEEMEEQGDSGMQAALVESKSLQESDEPRLLTTNASSIDRHLREFLPGILDQRNSDTAMDVCERYCAASLWTSSGLVQEAQAEEIAGWLVLREDEPARVAKTFEDLKHLQEPWMQGREGTDGKWERQVLEDLQLGTLGRFIFAMLLLYVREKVIGEPSSALEGFTLLSETIRQWDAETDEKRLERQFLLKELCIGRRNEHLPSWSGDVTQMRTHQVMPPKTDNVCV
jgi:hypothetical protein